MKIKMGLKMRSNLYKNCKILYKIMDWYKFCTIFVKNVVKIDSDFFRLKDLTGYIIK